ncbi:MAG: hypothetical protein M1347_08040 [Chloroflexi bacterium]|nr:hypothetical protein [Chloroflexota bacterium]
MAAQLDELGDSLLLVTTNKNVPEPILYLVGVTEPATNTIIPAVGLISDNQPRTHLNYDIELLEHVLNKTVNIYPTVFNHTGVWEGPRFYPVPESSLSGWMDRNWKLVENLHRGDNSPIRSFNEEDMARIFNGLAV